MSLCGLTWFLPYQGPSPEELGGDRWHCNPIRPGGEVVWHLLLFESFCHAVCDDLWEYEKCHSECQQVSKPTILFLMTRRLTIYTESVNFVEGIQVDALAIYSWLPTAAGGSDVGHLSRLRTTQASATASCCHVSSLRWYYGELRTTMLINIPRVSQLLSRSLIAGFSSSQRLSSSTSCAPTGRGQCSSVCISSGSHCRLVWQ